MSDYLHGSDVLGSDWGGSAVVLDDPSFGTPVTMDDATWGAPVEVLGHGGGHGGHGHGGHGGGFGGGSFGFWDDDDFMVNNGDSAADEALKAYAIKELLAKTSVRGSDVIGMFDLNATTKQMNTLKQVPVSVAQALLKGGQAAINQARATASANSLPGDTARDKIYWGLQWHQNALLPLASTPNAMYASGADLKKFVTSAYVEANAAEVGADYLDSAWSTMWRDISAALAALPQQVRTAVANTVSNVTGLPLWAWLTIAVGVLGAVSFLAVKLADTKLGAAVGGRLIP